MTTDTVAARRMVDTAFPSGPQVVWFDEEPTPSAVTVAWGCVTLLVSAAGVLVLLVAGGRALWAR